MNPNNPDRQERRSFNFLDDAPLIRQTEQTVRTGRTAGAPPAEGALPQKPWLKEPVRDILIHCPVSLHARLTERKRYRREELGLRETINDYAVEAIARWLDSEQPKEASSQP